MCPLTPRDTPPTTTTTRTQTASSLLSPADTMGLLALLRKLKRNDREGRILMLGLDCAGKTTILKVRTRGGRRGTPS
jgi:hypothetical protein